MKKAVIFLGVIVGAGVLLSGCQQSPPDRAATSTETTTQVETNSPAENQEAQNGATVTTTQSQESTGGTATSEQTTTIAIATDNFSFSTKEITVSKGTPLAVELTNSKGTHDFVIDELEVTSGIIPDGEKVVVTIPTDKPGTYEYYCSIGSHRTMGMVGTLTITE